jgi:hypothetical protein
MQDSVLDRRFSVDTTFVLFFLAMDFGQSAMSFGIDTMFSGITLGIVLVLPYFFPSSSEKPEFMSWLNVFASDPRPRGRSPLEVSAGANHRSRLIAPDFKGFLVAAKAC